MFDSSPAAFLSFPVTVRVRGDPERVMKLAGRMDCQGLLVQAILLLLLLSRGRARCSNGLLVTY